MTADAEISGKQQAISHPADIFGTPDDLKRLVNAMHKENIGVIADGMLHLWGIFHQGLRGLTERTFMRAVHSA